MWDRTDKLLVFIGGSCILFFLLIALTTYNLRWENKRRVEAVQQEVTQLKTLAENNAATNSIHAVLIQHHKDRLQGLEAEVELLKHATDAENIRWAKIATVRDIIRDTLVIAAIPPGCEIKPNTQEILATAGALVDATEERGVPLALAVAQARQESNFFNCAKSAAGARGIMQLMPYTAAQVAKDIGRNLKVYRIRDNVQMGVYYISEMLQEFDDNTELAVKAYNAGPTHVRRVVSGEHEEYYDETADYWDKVKGFMEEYQKRGL